MQIKKITPQIFNEYASTHPLRSYHQSPSYALYMSNKGYKHEYIALVDENNNIYAASLILFKKLGFINKYGYAPKGFLVNYHDESLIQILAKELKKFYYKRNFAFIKINPEIAIGYIDPTTKTVIYNKNNHIIDILQKNNFIRVGPNYKFETLQPRFNAIIPLKNFNFNSINKPFKTKIRKSNRIGLKLIKGTSEDIEKVYQFFKNKKNRTYKDYIAYYNAFNSNNSIDLFLVEIDYEKYLINARELYHNEVEKNNHLVDKMINNNNKDILKHKMESDRLLTTYKEDIIIATRCLAKRKTEYIAGAITIKYQNRINIIASGYDHRFKRINPNHFLHHELLKNYQNEYDFLDLNGITGEFTKSNPYYGLNKFKMSLNPKCFEYIGEFDLIINPGLYKGMKSSGLIKDEFEKKQKSI